MAEIGRPDWTTRCPTAELQAIHEWIDDAAAYKAIDIYRHLELARYTKPRTFRRYVETRRAQSREPIEDGVLSPETFTRQSLEQLARSAIGKAMLTGDIPGYALPKVLTSLARLAVAEYAADRNRREEELHVSKLSKAQRELARLAEPTADGGPPVLTPEQVAEIRAKVLGL